MIPEWGGRRVTEVARPHVARTLPRPCHLCGQTVTASDEWVVEHVKLRATHPELTWEPSNWAASHRACSNKTTQAAVIAKAKAEALREAGVSSQAVGAAEAPKLPFSPSGIPSAPFEIPEALTWASFVQQAPDWLLPYLALDANSNPPLAVSPLHPDATGTYADQAIPWIERVEGKKLRWWQALGVALKLQHDAEGRLLKRLVVETGPRRAGKSVGLRGLALWRMEHGPALFGERQEIVHTGSDLAVCRKAQKEAWRWAEGHWGSKAVTRGNGKEAIENPEDGSVWLVRAQDATYGWDTTLGLVDEGWDVKPDTVSEGLEPSLMGRQSPQLVMTSTSHRRARSTMRAALMTALTEQDPKTLLLWWGAPPGADPSDPKVWKAASPYWDDERAEFVASMYAKALAGEQDPEFDDPDPLRGFACQYTNLWNLKERRTVGNPITTSEAWAKISGQVLTGLTPDAVALEAWFEAGVCVVSAWRGEDGKVTVSAAEYAELADAVAAARALGCRRPLIVGASLVEDPCLKGVRFRPAKGRLTQAVGDLARLLAEGVLRHDGSPILAEQVTALRTLPAAEGMRVTSRHRADAVKAAVWAAAAARQTRSGGTRLILPTAS